MTVFIDTSALYAVLDKADGNHPAAVQTWTRLLSGDEVVLTTNYVLVETSALVQSRLGMKAVRTLNVDVVPALALEWLSPADHFAAVFVVQAADRRRLSLVDCTSFLVMRRLGLDSVFTFDRHFAEQGLAVIPS
ncbi:MAG: type II toxin-antitoxin system VapC family toxin [bacterium]|nr:type II toxin-antitoxin system VapC family toxin [bacterium]